MKFLKSWFPTFDVLSEYISVCSFIHGCCVSQGVSFPDSGWQGSGSAGCSGDQLGDGLWAAAALAIEFETFLFSKLLSQCPRSCPNEWDWWISHFIKFLPPVNDHVGVSFLNSLCDHFLPGILLLFIPQLSLPIKSPPLWACWAAFSKSATWHFLVSSRFSGSVLSHSCSNLDLSKCLVSMD